MSLLRKKKIGNKANDACKKKLISFKRKIKGTREILKI